MQTRQVQALVADEVVQVQLLSPAPTFEGAVMDIDPARIMSTAAWREAHDAHRPPGGDYTHEDAGHPDHEWIRLRCPCGATHLTTEAKAE
jgi:hypothetical protein